MVVLGLAAAGKAGKATSEGAEDNDVDGRPGDRELGPDGASQGVAVRPAVARVDADAMAGNGLALMVEAAALPQLRCLLTADREDCAVELLSLRTRCPPLPVTAADEPGSTPLGPGRDG